MKIQHVNDYILDVHLVARQEGGESGRMVDTVQVTGVPLAWPQ